MRTLVIFVLFLAVISAQSVYPLPQFAPIDNGTNWDGSQFIVYASTILNGLGTGGLWLTPLISCKNGNSWKFKTQSTFFEAEGLGQVSFELPGDFSWPLENGYTFALGSGGESVIVDVDAQITNKLNTIFTRRMSQWKKAMFGYAVNIKSTDFPDFYSNITEAEFVETYDSLYHVSWPKGFLTLLQALTWCNTYVYDPTYAANCAAILTPVTDTLLQLKSNEYNTDRQCPQLGCPGENPLPYPQPPYIGGSSICA